MCNAFAHVATLVLLQVLLLQSLTHFLSSLYLYIKTSLRAYLCAGTALSNSL